MHLPGPSVDVLEHDVERFRSAARHQLGTLTLAIEDRARSGRVVLWGAGSKGTAFLHALGPLARSVEAVIDVNPHLAGKYVAGTGHPILAPASLAEQPAGLVVAMNPVYLAEIGAEVDRLSPGARLVALGDGAPMTSMV
jgi:hypothetical protein